MVILTYSDNCIIAGRITKDIDSFVYSMPYGSEKLTLTDEGDVNKFLGIEIIHHGDSSLKLSQYFLIDCLLSLLGIGNNKFDTSTTTPVSKGLLNEDISDKPCDLSWKY